ncbi:hypothetical protein [Desulfovibrio cuneatus]|uniref:hypothetical protein n=1 Tax=Desulfovibrio cuneatus TaxID=159728 RepID=UPI000411DABA|nr:hypothetical protein [Desulfovibrio cuneatus]
MMDFDTMIDHIEQLQAENDAEDALDEQRLQALVAQYGEEQGQALFGEKYGSYSQAQVRLSEEEQQRYRAQGMDGVDMVRLFGVRA